jgi:small subunit ribosomal protein S24e
MQGEKIMEIQIIQDKTNSLLKRREISVSVKNKTTASRIELKNKLAALLNSKPELIVIEHLGTIYGKQEMMAKACLYQTEERLKQLTHQHLMARDAPKVVEGQEQAVVPTESKSPA